MVVTGHLPASRRDLNQLAAANPACGGGGWRRPYTLSELIVVRAGSKPSLGIDVTLAHGPRAG